MGEKTTISKEVLEAIRKATEKEVKKCIDAIIKANKESEAKQCYYFQETERLLYNLPSLKHKLAQDEKDLNKDLVVPPEKTRDMEWTKREIQRIERALKTIQNDEYYDIIPLKYWDLVQAAVIAEALHINERTFYRHKNHLINKLKVVLFGADALY